MQEKWSDMSSIQKGWFVITCVMLVVSIVMLVLDLTGTWKNRIYLYLVSVYTLVEGVMNWNKNRKIAIVDLVFAVVFAANAIMMK